MNSIQCRRSACRKADRLSMHMRMPTVANHHTAKPMKRPNVPACVGGCGGGEGV